MPKSQANKVLKDYLDLLASLQNSGANIVLVGGLAVQFWQNHYLDQLKHEELVFSKDIDFLIQSSMDLNKVEKSLCISLLRPKKPIPHHIIAAVHPDKEKRVEFLNNIRGVDSNLVIRTAVDANFHGVQLKIIELDLLFQSKLYNLTLPNQNERYDKEHARILAKIIPHRLQESLSNFRNAKIPERDQINLLKHWHTNLVGKKSQYQLELMNKIGVKVDKLFPIENFLHPTTPILNQFLTQTLEPMVKQLEKKQNMLLKIRKKEIIFKKPVAT